MWDLSQIYIVEDVGNGEVIALTDGTLNLRYVELNYTDTGAFSVEVTPHPDTDRSYTYPYSGASQLTKGKLRFPVMAENVNASISVVGESWRPFAFQSMSWEGYLSDKTKRI
jgi:hypothetical protein